MKPVSQRVFTTLFAAPNATQSQIQAQGIHLPVRGPLGKGGSNLIFGGLYMPTCGCQTGKVPRHRPGPFLPTER